MFWEREGDCILVEWTSRFPALQEALLAETVADVWRVELAHSMPATPAGSAMPADLRDIAIQYSKATAGPGR